MDVFSSSKAVRRARRRDSEHGTHTICQIFLFLSPITLGRYSTLHIPDRIASPFSSIVNFEENVSSSKGVKKNDLSKGHLRSPQRTTVQCAWKCDFDIQFIQLIFVFTEIEINRFVLYFQSCCLIVCCLTWLVCLLLTKGIYWSAALLGLCARKKSSVPALAFASNDGFFLSNDG